MKCKFNISLQIQGQIPHFNLPTFTNVHMTKSTNLDKIMRQVSPDPKVWGQNIARQYTQGKHGSIAK